MSDKLTNGSHRMPRRQQRKARRIHDLQPLHPDDISLRIDHGHRIICPPHLAGTRSMIDGSKILLDLLQDLCVRGDVEAGVDLAADNDGPQSGRIEHLADTLVAGYSDFLVTGIGEPGRVDERVNVHIRGLD